MFDTETQSKTNPNYLKKKSYIKSRIMVPENNWSIKKNVAFVI